MSESNRKPHLLRAKQEIVSLLDEAIKRKKSTLAQDGPDAPRDLAIFIRQRNRIAKDADLPVIPVTEKSGQGTLVYKGN